MLQNAAFPESIIEVSCQELQPKTSSDLQGAAVGFQPVEMISRYTANSQTKPSAQTPTGSGMFQRNASLREKLKAVELGLCFFLLNCNSFL